MLYVDELVITFPNRLHDTNKLIVHIGVIEGHGGVISANSPGPGKGSTFSVTLPLYRIRQSFQEGDLAHTGQSVNAVPLHSGAGGVGTASPSCADCKGHPAVSMSGAADPGEGNIIAGITTAGSINALSSRTSAASEPSRAPGPAVSTVLRSPPVPVPSLATEDVQPPKTPSEAVSPSPAPDPYPYPSSEKPESPEKSVGVYSACATQPAPRVDMKKPKKILVVDDAKLNRKMVCVSKYCRVLLLFSTCYDIYIC